MNHSEQNSQSLSTFSLWAIGVGLVISGESFGWNIGWGIIGAKSFFIPVLIAATLYFCLVKNLIELTCVYPCAEEPQNSDTEVPPTFAEKAYGKVIGNFVSIVLLVEFLFAIPAVANAISEYIGFLSGSHQFDLWIATGFLLAFCAINYFDIKLKTKFIILLTGLAIFELIIFSGAILPKFSFQNFTIGNHENPSIENILLALPYAVWMFLAIEGLSLFTKYVDRTKEFRITISSGYIYSILTLFMLCCVILILSGGSVVWNEEVWGFITSNSHPMPAILATVLGKESVIAGVFTFLGLFGLIASFQGVINTAIEQFGNIFRHTSNRFFLKNKVFSIILVLIVGLISIWSSSTGMLIEISVFCAVSFYFSVGLSLFKLRKNKHVNNAVCQHSEFSDIQSNSYIFLSSIISVICIFAFAYSQTKSFFIFTALSICYFSYWIYFNKLKI